jgi:hypothetical protein
VCYNKVVEKSECKPYGGVNTIFPKQLKTKENKKQYKLMAIPIFDPNNYKTLISYYGGVTKAQVQLTAGRYLMMSNCLRLQQNLSNICIPFQRELEPIKFGSSFLYSIVEYIYIYIYIYIYKIYIYIYIHTHSNTLINTFAARDNLSFLLECSGLIPYIDHTLVINPTGIKFTELTKKYDKNDVNSNDWLNQRRQSWPANIYSSGKGKCSMVDLEERKDKLD